MDDDGQHKRLPKSCRLNDESELPGFDWDNAKIAEVSKPEAWHYFCNKLMSPDVDLKSRRALLSRFELFYILEIESVFYEEWEDEPESDGGESDDSDFDDAFLHDNMQVFQKLPEVIDSVEEANKLIGLLQKSFEEHIKPELKKRFMTFNC